MLPTMIHAPLVLAVMGGVLCFLGFVGFGFYPLIFVAWVPLLYAIRAASPSHACLLGLLFGTVATAGGHYWIVHTLTVFGDVSGLVAVVALLILSVYQGSMMAVAIYIVRRADVALGLKPIWTLPVAYSAAEFVYPRIFPANLGAALYQAPALTQIVEVTGVLGLTALIAVVNGAVWEIIDARVSRRSLSRRRLAFAATIVLGTVVYGLIRLPMVDAETAAAPKLKVALIQANIGARDKLERRDESIARHRQLSSQAIERHPDLDLIVWPETAYGRLPRAVNNVTRVVTGGLGTHFVFGAITYEGAPGRRRFYNSAVLAAPTGDVIARFDKVRLVAFSETMPGAATWSALAPIIASSLPRASEFVPGATFEHFRTASATLLPTICYEGILPQFVRDFWHRAGPAEVLLNITNDSWFGNTHEPRIHLALASFRSIETRRAMIRSTNTGISALVDPAGRIYQRTDQWTEAVLTGEVPVIKSGAWPAYQVLGDVLGWACLALLAVGWVITATFRRRAAAIEAGAHPTAHYRSPP
jgi:apolipoprotein N-acyltransferase